MTKHTSTSLALIFALFFSKVSFTSIRSTQETVASEQLFRATIHPVFGALRFTICKVDCVQSQHRPTARGTAEVQSQTQGHRR